MPAPRGLVQRIDQSLHQSGLIPRRAHLLVAVSGGADSVALLRMLADISQSNHWDWTLLVAHVDHGIRGRESAADARFVASLAKSLSLRCVTKRLKLGASASEDTARQARFAALKSMVKTHRCHAVVMAHHADDQAETVLMRVFRGTGLAGLSAMAPSSNVQGLRILRPLLHIRRQQLRGYLAALGQTWREDLTNHSEFYLRNRVRKNLMPLVEVLWPGGVDALCRLAQLAGDSWQVISDCTDSAATLFPTHPHQLPREVFRRLPPAIASELLRRFIPIALDHERLHELRLHAQSPRSGQTIQLGQSLEVLISRDSLHLRPSPATRKLKSKIKSKKP